MLALRHIVAAWLVHGPAMAAGFSSRSAQAVPTARAFWRLPLGRIEAVVVFKRSILSGNPRRTFQAPQRRSVARWRAPPFQTTAPSSGRTSLS